MNVGPDADGNLPETAMERMREIGQWMQVNGAAIYGTRPIAPYKSGNICFTQKEDTVFAIYLADEDQKQMPSQVTMQLPIDPDSVHLLGSSESLVWTADDGTVRVEVPDSVRKTPPCRHAWAFEITPP